MKTVTNEFKEQIAQLGREIDFKFFLHTNDKIITEDGKFLMTEENMHLVVEQFDEEEVDEVITGDDIFNVAIVNKGKILSTMMKEVDFEVRQDLRIGDVIDCQFGLKVGGDYEYVDYGRYMIYSKEFNEDTKTYNYVAFDKMLLTMQEASQEFLTNLEGRTLDNCINVICGRVGLSFNATQEQLAEYPNLNKQINEGTFTDLQITYRDVLDMIAQALGLSMIVEDKYLRLKSLEDNSEYNVPYEIDGNTTQDGTPTSTNPIDIENITGEITHNGKRINLGDIELCKIGNYQDKIYKNDGKWYLHKEIGKVIINGSEVISLAPDDFQSVYRFAINNVITSKHSGQVYSNYFPWYADQANNTSFNNPTKDNEAINVRDDTRGIAIKISKSLVSSVNTLKTWLSNNNLIVYYILATATDTEITDNTLLEQLNEAEIVSNTFDEKYLKDTNVSFGKKYGPVNSVVLSRSEDNDNIYRRDEESVAENGVHEFKIKDNLIMLYDDREDYIDEIFEQLNGLEYYINDFNSTGITYLDWLDFYNVEIGDKTYKCLMLNDEIKIQQGLEETVYTEEPEETVTDYKTSSKTDKEVSFIVDKQKGQINAKVSKGDVINEINLDETGAEINAEKISLAGKTISMTTDNITIQSTNFNVDDDGNMSCTNANVNGTITSTDGTIGGWTINNLGLTNGVVKLNSDGSSTIYTVADLFVMKGYIMGIQPFDTMSPQMIAHYDLNNDGVVNAQDYVILQQLIGISM